MSGHMSSHMSSHMSNTVNMCHISKLAADAPVPEPVAAVRLRTLE
jgi:hypothetical protein